MSKDGDKDELRISRRASSNDEKSWIFDRFPTRYTSPRVQHARKDMLLQRQISGNRAYFQVPKISANFEMGFQLQGKPKEKSCDGNAERSCSETKLQRPISNGGSMPIDSFLVEKYELKERYKVVEIHKKVCKHCNFQNVIYKVKENVETGRYEPCLPGDPIYGRDRRATRWNDSTVSEDSFSTDNEAKATCLPTSIQPKKKLVVQMPNIRNSATSRNEDEIDKRPLLSYTHKKF